MKVLQENMYESPVRGVSLFSDRLVEIIGERTIEVDETVSEVYVYNIMGYTPANGKPFISLKSNIIIL